MNDLVRSYKLKMPADKQHYNEENQEDDVGLWLEYISSGRVDGSRMFPTHLP